MIRVRNIKGTIEEDFSQINDESLDLDIHSCSIHNCSETNRIVWGNVAIYKNYNGFYFFNYYALIPLCSSHNAQGYKMKSNCDDILCSDRENTVLILIKNTSKIIILNEKEEDFSKLIQSVFKR